MRIKALAWLMAAALIVLLIGCDSKPDPQQQAQAACEKTFGPLDWDVENSLSAIHSVALDKLSCDDQHKILTQLADIPASQRDEWLDRWAQSAASN